jgi:hypothetical protein
VLPCPAPPVGRVAELERVPDEAAAVALARVLVVASPALGEEVVAKLAAAAPAGVAVVNLAHVPPAALAANAPCAVLGLETAVRAAAISPRTRVGVAFASSSDAAAFGQTDIVWRAEGARAWDELAAALPALTGEAVASKGGR